MQRRRFLSAAVLGVAASPQAGAQQSAQGNRGPALLTVSGAITGVNRGPLYHIEVAAA